LGGLKPRQKTLPAQHHGNSRGIDLKNWTQHIERSKPKC
jgi:hypothetical protein